MRRRWVSEGFNVITGGGFVRRGALPLAIGDVRFALQAVDFALDDFGLDNEIGKAWPQSAGDLLKPRPSPDMGYGLAQADAVAVVAP